MSEKIYLKIDQQRYVKKPKVDIGDVMTVYCSDKDMIEKIGHITLVEFTLLGNVILLLSTRNRRRKAQCIGLR